MNAYGAIKQVLVTQDKAFIEAHQERLFNTCHDFYQKTGRGVFAMDAPALDAPQDWYEASTRWDDPSLNTWIDTYNPLREAVVLFLGPIPRAYVLKRP